MASNRIYMKALEEELDNEVLRSVRAGSEMTNPIAGKWSCESQPSMVHKAIEIVRNNRPVKIALALIVNLILIHILEYHLFQSASQHFLP